MGWDVLNQSAEQAVGFQKANRVLDLFLQRMFVVLQSIVLATTFAVSHNVPESKPLDAGPAQANLQQEIAERDW